MATVYRAYQPSLERFVALKILPVEFQQESGFSYRFRREARTAAKLEHPHILAVYDFGQEGHHSYIAMRYVESGTMQALMGRPLGINQIMNLIGQIADALDYAHQQGIVHRDVKPSNVLLYRDDYCLLADFGLAKAMDGTQHITATGVILGTPAYMSPEQARGDEVDERSDIYALGVILYELLTGHLPYVAESPFDMLIKLINEPIKLPREYNPGIPIAVENVLVKALMKNPDDRYQSASELTKAFRSALMAVKKEKETQQAAELQKLEESRRVEVSKPDFKVLLRKYWWLFLAFFAILAFMIVILVMLL